MAESEGFATNAGSPFQGLSVFLLLIILFGVSIFICIECFRRYNRGRSSSYGHSQISRRASRSRSLNRTSSMTSSPMIQGIAAVVPLVVDVDESDYAVPPDAQESKTNPDTDYAQLEATSGRLYENINSRSEGKDPLIELSRSHAKSVVSNDLVKSLPSHVVYKSGSDLGQSLFNTSASMLRPKPTLPCRRQVSVPSSVRSRLHSLTPKWNRNYTVPPNDEDLILSMFKEMACLETVPFRELKIGELIGKGNFATVHVAEWVTAKGESIQVAVKELVDNASLSDRIKFLQEAVIMGQFCHPHIVQLVGVSSANSKYFIVLELLENGSLLKYLKDIRQHTHEYDIEIIEECLIMFSMQITSGMNYLSNKHFIHRDLAARNILIDGNFYCKISDFGLARDVGSGSYTEKHGMIPIKWTAPEALMKQVYSSASDVWSFGVLLFEIWSLGQHPYPEHRSKEIGKLMKSLREGYRMPPPPGCPRSIYEIMIKCWHPNPEMRHTFSDIFAIFELKGSDLLDWKDTQDEVALQASIIGADLSHGTHLYLDLQMTYK